MKTLTITIDTKETVQVQAHPRTIPGYGAFFAHRPIRRMYDESIRQIDTGWVIAEPKYGMIVGKGTTIKAAVADATAHLEHVGTPEQFADLIESQAARAWGRPKSPPEPEPEPDLPGMHSYPTPTDSKPSMEDLEEWMFDGCALATDGCTVEPDGVCPHGHPSWLVYYGLI